MTKVKAFAYLRVSGAGQIQGHGFERQLEAITTFSKKNGYLIDKVYREQASGTKDETERTEFSAMVSEILRNGVRTVIVESLDRLAREYRIQEQMLVYLAAKDIDLIACNTGENVTKAISDDPMKKAMIQMQGIFAELDKSLLVRKLRKSREKIRKEQGKCEGRKSYKEKDPEILTHIQKFRRKRKGVKTMTFDAVAEKLNEMGYTATNGKPFNGNSVRGILHRHRKRR